MRQFTVFLYYHLALISDNFDVEYSDTHIKIGLSKAYFFQSMVTFFL